MAMAGIGMPPVDDDADQPVYRILLTGGPCGKQNKLINDPLPTSSLSSLSNRYHNQHTSLIGGKSSALEQLKRRFDELGKQHRRRLSLSLALISSLCLPGFHVCIVPENATFIFKNRSLHH